MGSNGLPWNTMPPLPTHNSAQVMQLEWHGGEEATALKAYSKILQAQAQAQAANNQKNLVLGEVCWVPDAQTLRPPSRTWEPSFLQSC